MQIQVLDENKPLSNGWGTTGVDVDDEMMKRYGAGLNMSVAPYVVDSRVGDAQEALAFLVSQLAYVETGVFERKYIPMQYEQLLPNGVISYAAGEAAKTIEYEIYDMVGQGQRISQASNVVPTVDVAYARLNFPVENGGIGYEYTTEELRVTSFLRRPISTAKLQTAMEAYRRHMNSVALFGEAISNITGLFNNGAVPEGNAPTTNWASATPDQIIASINAGINQVWTQTAFNTIPSMMAISPAAYSLLQQPRASFSDRSILSWVLENNLAKQLGGTFDIKPGFGLDTAGSGSTKRAVFYTPDNDNMTFHIPMPLRFLAPQLVGYKVIIPGEYKYSGVVFRRPATAYYMDSL